MANLTDIIKNIENIYNSNNSLNILKDYERVLDELNLYVYNNWIDGELVEGPKESKYWIECTFMWPEELMPDPKGGLNLIEYGCKVQVKKSVLAKVRKIKKPEDIRPGTRKGKIDFEPVWMVKITMPKKLINDISQGFYSSEYNKVDEGLPLNSALAPNTVEQQVQEISNEIPQI